MEPEKQCKQCGQDPGYSGLDESGICRYCVDDRSTNSATNAFREMHTSTLNKITGYQIVQEHGLVQGGLVGTKDALRDFGEGIQSFLGKELSTRSRLLETSRDEALRRLKAAAVREGGNAVIGIQIHVFALENEALGVNTYGTAVTVKPESEFK